MESRKLNEPRVHALIAQYAEENQGQIPSTTQIILLNAGKGSPSSANIYRKTYLLKLEQAKTPGSDPLAGFPEAVASAVKAMQASVEVKAQQQVAVIQGELAEKEKAWMEKHEDLAAQLAAALKDNAVLHGQLRETTLSKETLALEKDELAHQHTKATEKVKALEVELSENRDHRAELLRLLDDISPTLESHSKALTGVVDRQSALKQQVLVSGEAQAEGMVHLKAAFKSVTGAVKTGHQLQAALIEANKKASDSIAYQGSQYQTEIDRLNQLVDDLRQSIVKTRQADLAEAEKAVAKKIDEISSSSGDTTSLLLTILDAVEGLKDRGEESEQ